MFSDPFLAQRAMAIASPSAGCQAIRATRDPDSEIVPDTFFTDTFFTADVETIRRHLQRQHAYGSNRFREAIEAQLGRGVGPQKIGRPRKEKESGNQISATSSDSLSLPGL